MIVLMFKPEFAGFVGQGTKLQTVRPVRKRPIKVGTPVSLRCWSKLPYRSKQIVIRESVITSVGRIRMSDDHVSVNGVWLPGGSIFCELFAKEDGFPDWAAMRDWFAETHGLPFEGIVINWAP